MRVVSATIFAAVVATAPALVSASDQATPQPKSDKAVSTAPAKTTPSQFATLKDVKATPMEARELDAVKGLHVHFIDPHNGFNKVHLAGDVKTENNWSNEWGGTDGVAVAPSYHGLCVAHASGGIFIPTIGPITTECP